MTEQETANNPIVRHTPGAVRAAEIIMAGQQGSLIETRYGRKSVEGLADLIDRETAGPGLLEATKRLLRCTTHSGGCPCLISHEMNPICNCGLSDALAFARTAIGHATA